MTDAKPGELEQGEDSTLVINSIEDLVFFAYDVTNGNNYSGKTVKLGTSLDFNSTKSYVDIGITTTDDKSRIFSGIFDGKNNCIKNLYININSTEIQEKIGFFANNFGIINNLSLLNVNLYMNAKKGTIAGISGQNSTNGKINNCIVSGKIELETERGSAGGITGYCSGQINNCGNLADISVNTNLKENGTNCGGIFTSGSQNTEIVNCFNKGDISAKSKLDDLFVGGIGGTTAGKIENCYNSGKIIIEGADVIKVGGILGNIYRRRI